MGNKNPFLFFDLTVGGLGVGFTLSVITAQALAWVDENSEAWVDENSQAWTK